MIRALRQDAQSDFYRLSSLIRARFVGLMSTVSAFPTK